MIFMVYGNSPWRIFPYPSPHLIKERDSSVDDSVAEKNLGFKDHIYNMICVTLFASVKANCT